MRNIYDKMNHLIERGIPYVYEEKISLWIEYVVKKVLANSNEVEIVVSAMDLLSNNASSSEVLDFIYSTRYPLKTIHNILFGILYHYVDGPQFFRDIYRDYMVSDIQNLIDKVEQDNLTHKKR